MVLDIDDGYAELDWIDADLPPPHWISRTPQTTRGHIAYAISIPVVRTDAARTAPLRYLAAIQAAYTARLEADSGYAGLVTKNPLHPYWITSFPAADRPPYDLAYLADFVDLSRYRTPVRPMGLGRNCTLFDQGREWAYKAVRGYWRPGGYEGWQRVVLEQLSEYNAEFSVSLPTAEVRATAKSIARWVWNRITPAGMEELITRTHTSEIQARRGATPARNGSHKWSEAGQASGTARVAARASDREMVRQLREEGMSIRQIVAHTGIARATVYRWIATP